MNDFRLSHIADDDISSISEWSEEHFGQSARFRYEALLGAGIDHAAQSRGDRRFKARPELGAGVISWHLSNSTTRSNDGRVNHPRHILFCRWEGDTLAVGRVLHEVMDPSLHLTTDMDWS